MKNSNSPLDPPILMQYKFSLFVICTLLFSSFGFSTAPLSISLKPETVTPALTVNVPYWAAGAPYPVHSIFWFGKISLSNNYADVRMIYTDDQLEIVIHTIDRLLHYDASPSPAELSQWDAISIYLDQEGNSGSSPDLNSFRLVAQLNWWEPRDDYQAGFQGNGASWVAANIDFTTTAGWRGDALNNSGDDKGWDIVFTIPFTSLGLTGAPSQGSTWGLAVALHDRDSQSAAPLVDTVWPNQMNPGVPATWGQLRFGLPGYARPPVLPVGTAVIRQGLNSATVSDAHVGGHTTCGEDLDHWSEWGETNYAGYEQINIQNQWDVSDWPCFSKFYVTFPLYLIPTGQSIFSATLTMYMFGNSGGGIWGDPPDSYIQVLSVHSDWSESTLTWNNAPLAAENISGTWVFPMSTPDWKAYTWDVSRAVAEAYTSGTPLRLALYSADGEMHSGKYFFSSDISDYDAYARPTLRVSYGDLCSSPGVTCSYSYLPLLTR